MRLLGIDVGTGGTRAVVVDEQGRVLQSATGEHAPFASPRTGWAEQDPRDWWRACGEAVRAVLASGNLVAGDISCVGLSGQMHGAVLLDGRDQVLRPSIIWCDQRTDEECRIITEKLGADRLIELTCNPALTGFTLPKLMWVHRNEPDLWARLRSVLLPKDYVRLRLTGERATDVADASGTLLFTSPSAAGPRVIAAGEVTSAGSPQSLSRRSHGRISRSAAATGLKEGTRGCSGGDQAAGAFWNGHRAARCCSAAMELLVWCLQRPIGLRLTPAPGAHFCHSAPGRWHVMGVTQAAGLSLRWFRDRFGAGEDHGRDPYDRLCDEAAGVAPGADGVLWAPYLMGERTPHLDPHARAALVGLAASHTRAHVIRAISKA